MACMIASLPFGGEIPMEPNGIHQAIGFWEFMAGSGLLVVLGLLIRGAFWLREMRESRKRNASEDTMPAEYECRWHEVGGPM